MSNIHNTYTKIIAGIEKYFREAGNPNAVIGLSGGIDSSVCLKLLVDALGPERVSALSMPEKGVSSEQNIDHAKALAKYLNVSFHLLPINKYLLNFLALPWKSNKTAQMNTKARIRMIILYNFANTNNALVVGTSNKTELYIGYGTKYGDLGVDLDIIGDLFKEDVYALAEHLGLPRELIDKAPSAELYSGQTDEEELGMSYKEIDNILKYVEQGAAKEEIVGKGLNPNSVHKIFRLIESNKHKTISPYIIPVKD